MALRWQYQGKAEPVSTSHESVLLDKWLPNYPNQIPGVKRPVYDAGYTRPIVPLVFIDQWAPTYPTRLDPARRAFWQGEFRSSSYPIATLDQWMPSFPVRVDPSRKPFWGGEYSRDLRPLIFVDDWIPVFPSRIEGRRQNPQDYLVNPYLSHVPSAETLTMDKWAPSFPSRLDPRRIPFWEGQYAVDADISHIPVVPLAKSYPGVIVLGYNPMSQEGPTIGGGW